MNCDRRSTHWQEGPPRTRAEMIDELRTVLTADPDRPHPPGAAMQDALDVVFAHVRGLSGPDGLGAEAAQALQSDQGPAGSADHTARRATGIPRTHAACRGSAVRRRRLPDDLFCLPALRWPLNGVVPVSGGQSQ